MRAILINAEEQTVTEVEYDGELDTLYRLLNCDTIDAVHVATGPHTIFVDDEGLLKGSTKFFCIPALYAGWLAGNGLIVGFDHETGDSTPCKFSVEGIRQLTYFEDRVGVYA